MKQVIYALHGFLGVSTDWQSVQKIIQSEKPDWSFVAVDLFQTPELSPAYNFDKWTQNFYRWLYQYEADHFPNQEIKRTIAGYSLGGRLALHVVNAQPDAWSGAVFLSTNPGLSNEAEKMQRLESDKKWSEKFLKQSFQETLIEWNNQGVLKDSFEPSRQESSYQKSDLAGALLNWSLARQRDFRTLIDLWHIRQLWIAGEKDSKFCEILKTLPQTNEIQGWVVEGASHRLIFEAPEEVAHFLIRVSSPLPEDET